MGSYLSKNEQSEKKGINKILVVPNESENIAKIEITEKTDLEEIDIKISEEYNEEEGQMELDAKLLELAKFRKLLSDEEKEELSEKYREWTGGPHDQVYSKAFADHFSDAKQYVVMVVDQTDNFFSQDPEAEYLNFMEMEELLQQGARNISLDDEYSPLFEIIFSTRRTKQLEAIELILEYFPQGMFSEST